MRIVVIGQAAFGEQVLKRLLEKGYEVAGVSAPPHPAGGKPEPLRALAESKGLPVFGTADLRKADVFAAYAALKPDLNVMAFVTDILRENVLTAPRLGTIQYHPSLLPRHRGASAMNWAIIQGDKRTGLTVFWVDKGIDTGAVLLQKEVEITADDTLGTLYFNKLFAMGVEALEESVALVAAGRAPRVAQDESKATYEPICTEEHGKIEWGKPATEVYNRIRGCNPAPGAYTTYKGAALKIFDCTLAKDAAQGKSPGTITAVTEKGFSVALRGGTLQVARVQAKGFAKATGGEYAKSAGLQAGDTLGG
ncbi:MAG: methionyl-tRNA formyltransferase [Dehalococcoidia bacterium]|nr:methionyl-tRNA formyltransferase [Dehalococcoidia bacterium]